MLHGFDGNHENALFGLTPAQALALRVAGTPLPPMALVTVDGGCDAEGVTEGGDERTGVAAAARGDGAVRGEKQHGVL